MPSYYSDRSTTNLSTTTNTTPATSISANPSSGPSASLGVRASSSVVGVSGASGGEARASRSYSSSSHNNGHHPHHHHHYYHNNSSSSQDQRSDHATTTTAAPSTSARVRRYHRSHAGGSSAHHHASALIQNEFPWFGQSGDVEIVVRVASGHENRYLLHRHTLTRCSGFFEASTSNEWSRAREVPEHALLSSAVGAIEGGDDGGEEGGGQQQQQQQQQLARIEGGGGGGDDGGSETGGRTRAGTVATSLQQAQQQLGLGPLRKRWRYELDQGTGDNDIPMLLQKEETLSLMKALQRAQPPPTASIFGGGDGSSSSSRHKSFFRSVANLSLTSSSHHQHHRATPPAPAQPPPTPAEQDLLRDYDNMFRIMYNYAPHLDGISVADAYVQCKSLLALADQYDALEVVGPRVDHHLLQFRSRLWRQVAKYPVSYLRLGHLARSKVIFQEALCHVVGQWPAGERALRAGMPPAVLDLIEDKVDELDEAVARVESRLFRLTLTTRAGEPVTPANGFLDWLAVSLFRQWLVDNTAAPPPPPPMPLHVQQQQQQQQQQQRTSRGLAPGGARARLGSSSSSSTTNSSSSSNNGGGGGAAAGNINSILGGPVGFGNHYHGASTLGRTYRMLGGGSGSSSGSNHDTGNNKGTLSTRGGGAGGGAGGASSSLSSSSSSSYLGHDECKRFLKLAGDLYSRDNLRRFERRVEELKAMAREAVRPLMASGLELESSAAGLAYLTCTTLGERDLPWGEGYD